MNRQQKLNTLESRFAGKKIPVAADGKPFLIALEKTIKQLTDSLDVGVDLNADELIQKLQEVGALSEELKTLEQSIKDLRFPDIPDSVKLTGVEPLIAYIKTLPRKDIDLSPIEKVTSSIQKLTQKIDDITVPKQGQKPEDYIPMRRVVKMGNKLLYDDSFYTGGGGGGSVPDTLKVTNSDGSTINSIGELVPYAYDYISVTPDTSRPTTVVYKTGGSGGTTVATITIAYDGTTSNITSVTRS